MNHLLPHRCRCVPLRQGLLDADADRADLELRLIKLLLKDRAAVHPFAGNGGSWREADIRPNVALDP